MLIIYAKDDMISSLIKKVFVLDTNVVLHDAKCLDRFGPHDVVVPITVIEELDRFKRGHDDLSFQSRQFLRTLDELAGAILDPEGVSLGPNRGRIRVSWGEQLDEKLKLSFMQDSPDHRILNSAIRLQMQRPEITVVLISKDTNLRLKAKALGVIAEDYEADKVRSFDELYSGKRTVSDIDAASIEMFFASDDPVPASALPQLQDVIANECFVLKSGSKSVLATYSAERQAFVRLTRRSAFGIQPRNAEQTFALNALLDENIRLVTLSGRAGTGKTLLALAAALEQRSKFRQILLARPIVPLSNRDLGFLPGDVQEKLAPYMQPLFDNLNVIRSQFKETDPEAKRINEMLELEKLLITPLSYIRGRTLQKMYFIVDEAQNLTPHEVKTVITRAAEGTKIVFTGDLHQIDHPYLDALSNGLSHLVNRMKCQPLFAHVTLEKGERSPLADLASELL
jgi:PhoH-like ATPase